MPCIKIHNNMSDYADFLQNVDDRLKDKKKFLQYWDKFDNILMSNDKFYIHFAHSLDNVWEMHIAFDKEIRGKKSIKIIKECVKWMLENKTPTIICGIPEERKEVRLLANMTGFKKIVSKDGKEFYKIEV